MEIGSENPYASLFWDALTQAKSQRASDVHIQPERDGVSIRFRVNGELISWKKIGIVHKPVFLQEAKRLSQCSVAVSGRAQDARISLSNLALDVRVNLVPSVHGEKLVLRLLDQSRVFCLKDMNLSDDATTAVRRALSRETGVCLMTGPTGSGKTTLLYSALEAIDRASLNVVTIEDPVEYSFQGITQVQVSPKLTFADALRAMLRQDPDVILVGEVRDRETAELCFQAAATGHLVLSTLHANGAREVAGRLRGLGVREDQVADCLRFASAQRLVGRLCPDCRQPLAEAEQRELCPSATEPLWKRNDAGCTRCQRGLLGRLPLFEYVEPGAGRQSCSLRDAAMAFAQEGKVDAYECISAA